MVADLIGSAVVACGGGMMTASSYALARHHRHWRSPREIGTGLANALADTTAAPIPADMTALLDRIP